MPILEIEAVLLEGEAIGPHWASEISNAAGKIFDTPSGQTWVRVRGLPRSHYAENSTGSSLELSPVFVSVLKEQLPEPKELRIEIEELTTAVARVTERPEVNVHVIYLPPGAGRIAFGGRLVE